MPHKAMTEALKPKRRRVPAGYTTNLPALATKTTFRTMGDVDSLFPGGDRNAEVQEGRASASLMSGSSSALVLLDPSGVPQGRAMSVPLGQGGASPSGLANVSATTTVSRRKASPKHRYDNTVEANDALPPNPYKSTLAPQIAKKIDGIEKFISEELRILATQCETALEGSQQRLSVFQSAGKMLQSALHPDVARLFERVIHEYDLCLRTVERTSSETSLMKERKKIEDHYHVHYTQVAVAKEKMLEEKKLEFQNTESRILANYKRLENQVTTLREDNEKLRRSQNEDHDRMLSMSQAVIESRLAMQKAELASKEAVLEVKKFRTAEKQNFELINDHQDMSKLLRQHSISFEARCKFAVDALLGAAR